MKMVKSLLLGSAAGLVAVTAGQAADLPVKAKPVEYVKVCSLYGAGFYYMPGTDLCLKIGGWVRAEASWGMNGTFSTNPMSANLQQRGTNNMAFRGRGYITADAREQTAYGTARGYIAVGLSTNDLGLNTAANQFSANRAFIQFAGFTGGISQSFYDYFSSCRCWLSVRWYRRFRYRRSGLDGVRLYGAAGQRPIGDVGDGNPSYDADHRRHYRGYWL